VELERGIPLNPLLDALSDIDLEPHLEAIGPPWSSVIASLLPPGALDHPPEDPPPIQPSSLSRRLLDSFALLFEHLAREQPTILFLDDLQWADATTIATLQFMQRRWMRGSLGIFATLRQELVRPDDAVAKYLGATAGLRVRRIELSSLAASEARALVDAIGEGRVPGDRATHLCSIAGHHPLYLTELTREFLAGGLTLPERPADQMRIPSSLAQMLDARLKVMDDRAMRVAGVLAVAAKPLRVGDIAELAGLGIDNAASAVETLVAARFIEVEHAHIRIAHELFRGAVYRRLSEPRRAIHHSAIARHLLSGSGDELTGEVAIHFSRAGEAGLAAEYGWAAATRALDAGALAEAAQFFEVVAESEVDPVRKADATAELAKVVKS
jgi:predicted ATPase